MRPNNNNCDNVYGAVIMTIAIARVHPVQTERRVAAANHDPSDQAADLQL